jgi:hypothetical protein
LLTVAGASNANKSQTITPRLVVKVAVYFFAASIDIAGGLGYCLDIIVSPEK